MYLSKIAYIMEKQLDELKETLNKLNVNFVEKIESEMNLEVWVQYNDKLVDNLLKAGFLSNKDKEGLNKVEQSIGITEILFYA